MPRSRSFRQHLQWLIGASMLAMGLALSIGTYLQLTRLAEEDAAQRVADLARQSAHAVDRLFLPSLTTLQLLAGATPLQQTEVWLERLPELAAALRGNPVAVGLYQGDAEGGYVNLRRIEEAERAHFAAAEGTRYLLQLQPAVDGAPGPQQQIQFDATLRRLGERMDAGAPFDPRTRPWYHAALAREGIARTPPYTFFSSGRPGLSFALQAAPGRVLAIDVELATLGPRLAEIGADAAHLWLLDGDTLVAADPRADVSLLETLRGGGADFVAGGGSIRRAGDWWFARLPMTQREYGDLQLGVAISRSALLEPALKVRNASLALTAILVLLALLLSARTALRVSLPLQRLRTHVDALRRFDFDSAGAPQSSIREVDELARDFDRMRDTLQRFLDLLRKVAETPDLDHLLPLIVAQTSAAVESDSAALYLEDGGEWTLRASVGAAAGADWLARWRAHSTAGTTTTSLLERSDSGGFGLVTPLRGRRGDLLGLLVFERHEAFSTSRARFAEALSGFSALTLESRELIAQQKRLFDAFIMLIADAVDAKSPHTGGHCKRVPALTEMLVELAAASDLPAVAGFQPDEELLEAVHIAAWLHDCGKVATPDFVIDKATKLETLYDRIHEVRMRFEVLKKEAEISYWKQRVEGVEPAVADAALQSLHAALDAEFAFVAECNLGGEFLDADKIARLQRIGARRWTRTLDERLGISHDEQRRRAAEPAAALPVSEPLLSDRAWHRIPRPPTQKLAEDNPWGFRIHVPEWLYDRGELKNLSVSRGTLTDEERYKINEHIVLTIRMLEALPFPRHLQCVPEIAGGHHERMDGRGYPRAIPAGELSIPARLMAIADVFEALTASDRPYKPGKTVQEALAIMRDMAAKAHLDPDLYALFEASDVPLRYARRFLDASQYESA